MGGLWFSRRLAKYLTLLATVALIPIEIYELSLSVSVFKVITLVINVAIAVYLLWPASVRTAGRPPVQEERHRQFSGWGAIERSAPAVSSAAP